jgi:aminoglycoside phosphotransferase (APT) family kinase protein
MDLALGIIPRVMDELPLMAGGTEPESWKIERAARTSTGSIVVSLGPPGRPEALVKLPQTAAARLAIRHEADSLQSIRDEAAGMEWLQLLPEIIAAGTVGDQTFAMYRLLPGTSPRPLFDQRALLESIQTDAAMTIGHLHRLRQESVVVDDRRFTSWVEEPADAVLRALSRRPPGLRHSRAFSRLLDELRSALAGATVSVGWIHGDLWLGNLLVDSASGHLSGIVDWDKASPSELASHDLCHLVVFTRSLLERQDLGGMVTDILNGRHLSHEEEAIFQSGPSSTGTPSLDLRTSLLLYWLRQVALEVEAHRRNELFLYSSLLWESRNIDRVLSAL